MNTRVLPAGTVIYRARSANDPTFHLDANHCGDTGKTGLYYSDYKLLCIGMAVEYQKDIHLCTYLVERPIVLYEGKYSFRGINPERFLNGLDVEVIPEENISHFDAEAIPIYEEADQVHRSQPDNLFGEIFIAEGELQGLTFMHMEEISLEQANCIVFGN